MAWWRFWVSSWWRSHCGEVGARNWSPTAHGWCGEEAFPQGSQDSVCKGVDHAPAYSLSLPNWSHWDMWGLLPLVSFFHEHKSCWLFLRSNPKPLNQSILTLKLHEFPKQGWALFFIFLPLFQLPLSSTPTPSPIAIASHILCSLSQTYLSLASSGLFPFFLLRADQVLPPLGSLPWSLYVPSWSWKSCFDSLVCVCLLSCVQLFAVPWTVAHQTLLSTEFSRQEYWSGLPFHTREFFCELRDAIWGPPIMHCLIGPKDKLASFESSQSVHLQKLASAFSLQSLSLGLCIFCKWPKEDSLRWLK